MDEKHVLFRLMLAIKEPRVARIRVYELPQILFCTVVAMRSGATDLSWGAGEFGPREVWRY